MGNLARGLRPGVPLLLPSRRRSATVTAVSLTARCSSGRIVWPTGWARWGWPRGSGSACCCRTCWSSSRPSTASGRPARCWCRCRRGRRRPRNAPTWSRPRATTLIYHAEFDDVAAEIMAGLTNLKSVIRVADRAVVGRRGRRVDGLRRALRRPAGKPPAGDGARARRGLRAVHLGEHGRAEGCGQLALHLGALQHHRRPGDRRYPSRARSSRMAPR